MASVVTVISRFCYRSPTRPLFVGALILLILVSWKFFSTQPDANAIRRLDMLSASQIPRSKTMSIKLNSKTKSKSIKAKLRVGFQSQLEDEYEPSPRKRLVNIPFEQDKEDEGDEELKEVEEDDAGAKSNHIESQLLEPEDENIQRDEKHTQSDEKQVKQELEENTVRIREALRLTEKEGVFLNTSGSGLNEQLHVGQYNVLLTLVKMMPNSPLAKSLNQCIKSICRYTTIDITFHVVVDQLGKLGVENIFKDKTKKCNKLDVVYYDVHSITNKLKPLIHMLQESFSSGSKSYYNDPIFFMSTSLHRVLPQQLTKIIMLDSDLRFASDIKLLFDMFDDFEASNIIGLALEQSPVYRHAFQLYRNLHRGTRVGAPPPNGNTGFNSGVVLFNLENMRKANIYNQILGGQVIKEIVNKYQFHGHLGDQDFYTLLSIEYPELFFILPCSWNRQLCKWWRDNGYSEVFNLYNNCSEPIHVYHGNCRTQIPITENED